MLDSLLIPKHILYDEDLNINQKVILSVLYSDEEKFFILKEISDITGLTRQKVAKEMVYLIAYGVATKTKTMIDEKIFTIYKYYDVDDMYKNYVLKSIEK